MVMAVGSVSHSPLQHVRLLHMRACHAGGPTLVTDQPFSGTTVARHAWIVHPSVNRLAMLEGSMLHGVLPGRGPAPGGDTLARRVTVMVAFWRELQIRPAGPGGAPGASRPFPDPCEAAAAPAPCGATAAEAGAGAAEEAAGAPAMAGAAPCGTGGGSAAMDTDSAAPAGAAASDAPTWRFTWPAAFHLQPGGWGGCEPVDIPALALEGPVWEDVDREANRAAGCLLADLQALPKYELCFQGF